MLKRVDRVQIAVANLHAAEKVAADTFGAELLRRDTAEPLNASRSTMQAGSSLIELLAPAGAGPVKGFVDRWTSGLFGVGFSVTDLDAAARHLQVEGIKFDRDAGQLHIASAAAGFGMRVVLSTHHERAPVGAIKWIYETTNVVGDWRAASARYTRMFRLNPAIFVPIESKEFGYTGTLTMFDAPARLDRIEISQIINPAGAMGRFHQKRGDSLYMFFVETDDADAIAKRLESRGARFAAHTRDAAGLAELFIHPSSFLGVLVGVSRTEHAWTWSGDLDRARRAAASRAERV
ncbi:MAG TPA: VOC family protein [Candidatus Binataceae bacterium]|nr:VOC family protein [Candidatus Binataceae bacterium]